jgi:PAS domain S-box-containing protein
MPLQLHDELSRIGTARSRPAAMEDATERVACLVVQAACVCVTLLAGLTLIGWFLANARLIHFPATSSFGTMAPLTATNLLLCAGSLWLLRSGKLQRGPTHRLPVVLAMVPGVFAVLMLVEHALRVDLGIDLLLFPRGTVALIPHLPGRTSVAGSLCFLVISLALLCLDARKRWLRRASEILAFAAGFIALERTITYAFGEAGLYAPGWSLFGEPILNPMSPKTSLCFVALALGILCARPRRGLVGLFLSRGTGGGLARQLLPAAVLVPVAFGLLGLPAVYGDLRGFALTYPLSLVVSLMILVLLLVISLSARTIQRVDDERNRALEALAGREKLLSDVFDNAGSGIALLNLEGSTVATNQVLRDLLGYDEHELAGRSFTDFLHPDDSVARWKRQLVYLSREGETCRFEQRLVRKDGRMVWTQVHISGARDERNAALFWIAMVDDITERKAAEEAQQRLTAILEATPDVVGIADAHARVQFLNRSGRAFTGIADEDVSGLRIPDLHPNWASKRIMDDGLPGAMRNGLWTGETALLSAEGEEIPVSQVILSHRGPDGEIAYLSTIMRDISDRKQVENVQRFLLEASRALSGSLEIDAVLDKIAELVVPERADYCVIDLVAEDGSIERVAMTHARPEQQPLLEQLRAYPAIDQRAGVAEVVRTGEPLLVRHVTGDRLAAMTQDRKHLEIAQKLGPRSVMIVPMLARGRVTGAISFVLTTPARHYGRQDLALAQELAGRAGLAIENARLYRQSRMATTIRDEVLGVVAHDLRNPLNTILLTAGLLQERLQGDEHAQERNSLDIIDRSIAQADRLIQDLLDVASMEKGKLPLERQPVDPVALIHEAIELHRALADERGTQLDAHIPANLSRIWADRQRLLQVFANLIGNALKFSPEGSHVQLTVAQEDHRLRFSVQDDGPGIARQDQPYLFDPFWQAREGTGGAGLGLSIARGIVEAHGGRIWAESELGKGTTFYFTVPLMTSERQSMAAD